MYIVSPFVFEKNFCFPIVLNFFLYIKSNRCSSEYGYVDNLLYLRNFLSSVLVYSNVGNCGYLVSEQLKQLRRSSLPKHLL